MPTCCIRPWRRPFCSVPAFILATGSPRWRSCQGLACRVMARMRARVRPRLISRERQLLGPVPRGVQVLRLEHRRLSMPVRLRRSVRLWRRTGTSWRGISIWVMEGWRGTMMPRALVSPSEGRSDPRNQMRRLAPMMLLPSRRRGRGPRPLLRPGRAGRRRGRPSVDLARCSSYTSWFSIFIGFIWCVRIIWFSQFCAAGTTFYDSPFHLFSAIY